MEEIVFKNFEKKYDSKHGIFDFNLNIKQGECIAIMGVNGSGKTTTLRNIMGFLKPTSGSITVFGNDSWKNDIEIKKLVSYLPGQIDFPDLKTGRKFLKSQASLLGLKDFTKMEYLIDLFKINIDTPLKRMSKGMKQKMGIIATFMIERDIYLLDEPSTGLDPLMRDALIQVINEHKSRGKTIILSSHIFKEVEDTSDRIIIIKNGKFLNEVSKEEILNKNKKSYKVVFELNEEYESFKEKGFKFNDNKNSVYVKDIEINELMKELSKYKIIEFEIIEYSLEEYYRELMEENENVM